VNNLFVDFAKVLTAAIFSVGVFLAIISWIRHSKEDAAKAKKTEAEAEEIKEKWAMLKTQRDEIIFERQEKLIERLNTECEATRKELDEALDKLRDVTTKCSHLEKDLIAAQERNRTQASEIEQLQIEVNRLRRENNRRPL
jgi:uncharacterized coiled-coil protein SlyX